jgi:ribosome-binding protein aMBF1 (putative translation factor)
MTLTSYSNTSPMMTERAVDGAARRHDVAIATGRRVRWAREQAGISRAELARYADMSATTLARVENGERILTGRERAALARGVGVSIGLLTVASTNGNGKAAA